MKFGGTVGCCELCRSPARVYCVADEASLCWQCDAYVHGANFLAARHLRSFLCHTCGALTEWLKAGFMIDPKIPFCQRCFSEVNCLGELVKDDEESRSVSSAFSTKASFSGSGVGRRGMWERKANQRNGASEDGSKRQKIDNGSSSDSTQRLLVLLRKTEDVQLKSPAQMCCKEWTRAASFDGEMDCGLSYEKCTAYLPSTRKQSGVVEKISSAVQVTPEDGCNTESSASTIVATLKYIPIRTTTKQRSKRIRKNHLLRGSMATSSASSGKNRLVEGPFKG